MRLVGAVGAVGFEDFVELPGDAGGIDVGGVDESETVFRDVEADVDIGVVAFVDVEEGVLGHVALGEQVGAEAFADRSERRRSLDRRGIGERRGRIAAAH